MICLDPDRGLLLSQFEKSGHPHSGYWTLPGGGMEWGEQAHLTALRELKEETGLDATVGRLLGVQSEWFDPDVAAGKPSGHALRVIFEATSAVGDLKTDFSDDDTTVAAAWFTLEEVSQLDRVPLVDFGLSLTS